MSGFERDTKPIDWVWASWYLIKFFPEKWFLFLSGLHAECGVKALPWKVFIILKEDQIKSVLYQSSGGVAVTYFLELPRNLALISSYAAKNVAELPQQ
jgi:hypothetical protein